MCNFKQYLDKQYAISFFKDNGRNDLADIYMEISGLVDIMKSQIPQDFTAAHIFSDKALLEPYCVSISQICKLEEKALTLL
jgi:hypothetical protein